MASEELECRLFDILIKTFDELGEEREMTLVNACKKSSDSIIVTNPYTLSESQQQLEQKLNTLCEQSVMQLIILMIRLTN